MNTDIHALSGAYAVDALDDIERAQFERHLAECEACRAEVMSLQEAASLLAETTTVQPSAELRERVLTGISTVRPLPPFVERPDEPEAEAETSDDATVVPLAPRRRRRVASFLVAAAAAVAIGSGGLVAVQQLTDDTPQDDYSRVVQADDAQTFRVPVGDGGSVTVVRSAKLNDAYIVTKGMPAAPTGKQYVLWLKHGGTMTQAGVMPARADNKVRFSGDAASADGAAVSIEDAGSDPTSPSGEIAAAFSFA
jgi:anti-sigma-K factor RskA